MKQSLESSLESLKKPDVSAPLHQSALKRGLLASKKAKSLFIPMNLFKLLPAGAAVALVMAILLHAPSGTSVDPFVTPTASAQELIMQVSEQIQALSPEEVAALEERLGVSRLSNTLQEAQQAEDLNDLPLVEETVVAVDGKDYCIVMMDKLQAFASDQPNCISDFEGQRSVIFTSSDGSIVIMLVDEDLFPSQIYSFHLNGDATMTFMLSGMIGYSSEEALHFATINLERDLSLEENRGRLLQELPSMFEQGIVIPDHEYILDEGMIGGGTEE